MKKGAVAVDVSVDQGGCFETTRPTTHQDPVYEVEGVLHYAVTNMPGAVPRTSTFALTHATLPYLIKLADFGFKKAIKEDQAILKGVNLYEGKVTHPAVAEAINSRYEPLLR
jgi:alanine dehydrogenase